MQLLNGLFATAVLAAFAAAEGGIVPPGYVPPAYPPAVHCTTQVPVDPRIEPYCSTTDKPDCCTHMLTDLLSDMRQALGYLAIGDGLDASRYFAEDVLFMFGPPGTPFIRGRQALLDNILLPLTSVNDILVDNSQLEIQAVCPTSVAFAGFSNSTLFDRATFATTNVLTQVSQVWAPNPKYGVCPYDPKWQCIMEFRIIIKVF